MTNENIEQQRLEDFKKILTYHLVTKIEHFNISVKDFYSAGFNYKNFKDGKIGYARSIFKDQAIFNACGLRREQVARIFGFNKFHQRIKYEDLIQQDTDITVRKHGTQFNKAKHTRIPFSKCYLLPQSLIQSISDDPILLKRVKDAKSGYYTARQRRLIFSLLIGKQQDPKQDDDATTITTIKSAAQAKSEFMQKIVRMVSEKKFAHCFGKDLWVLLGGNEQNFKPQIRFEDQHYFQENVTSFQEGIDLLNYAKDHREELGLTDAIIQSIDKMLEIRKNHLRIEQDFVKPAPEPSPAPIPKVVKEEREPTEEEIKAMIDELEMP